jgi:hypothetical protein
MSATLLIALALGITDPKPITKKIATQDTTTVAYWKQRAKEAEKAAKTAELAANRSAMEAQAQMSLANRNIEVAMKNAQSAKQQGTGAQDKINQLNKIIAQQKKQLDECAKKGQVK